MPAMFRHLHIVACSPRSGTTLLHEVMLTCYSIDKHYEHEMRFNRVTADSGQLLLTKRPKDTIYMPAVLDCVAEFFVIYLLRDPRDVIVSRHGKDRSRYYANIRLWRELHAAARKMYGQARFLEIRYEDFVSTPDAVQLAIEQRFPWLTRRHLFSEYHHHATVSEKSAKAMHGVRAIGSSSVGAWRQNVARIRGQQDRHGSLTPDLVECGYEPDAAWETLLDGVAADRSPSYYPERIYPWGRLSQRLDGMRKISTYLRKQRVQ
jgi:hypothetical protein